MTIKLAPKSKEIELFFINVLDSEINDAVIAIKKLKQSLGNTIGGINLMNQERLLSMLMEYPQEKILDRSALSAELVNKKMKQHMIAPWTIIGAVYGDKKIVKAVKSIIKENMKPIKGRKLFLNKGKIAFLDKVVNFLPRFIGLDLKDTLKGLKELVSILNGTPQNTALKLAYWKNIHIKPEGNLNPNRDECGLIWYAPLVEIHPKKVREYIDFIKSTSKQFDISPLITLTTVDDLCFDSTIPILFNRKDIEDQKRAHAYFETLFKEGKKLGFYPYRLGTNSMEFFFDDLDDPYKNILTVIKKAFDKDELFAPNRYAPKSKKSSTDKRLYNV